eukprot:TRINITY_DN72570_c0_g1_i1.p1 TRINITY_DN72570_c0_g1~~TRINITY_DN72570_c0_g1_i1.p1  ORF type:complete len:232 (+),score=68.83 TRINITY_DN72570_c0_g1_i1:103-696(+)
MKKRLMQIEPTVTRLPGGGELQYSVHGCSRPMMDDMRTTLPAVPAASLRELRIIPTFQPTQCPVLEFTAEAAAEKDRLLCQFLGFAREFVRAVEAEGHWADFCDPVTGMPSERGAQPYSEAAGAEALLPYPLVHVGTGAGGCRMVEHPRWGLAVYPATLFATAPLEVVQRALQAASGAAALSAQEAGLGDGAAAADS